MKKLILAFMLIFGYAQDLAHTQSTQRIKSALYNKWVKQWGNHKWDNRSSNPAATNKAYSFESAYIIVDMIKADDIAGLELIYKALEKDKEHNMAF